MFEAIGQAFVVLFSPQYAWLFLLGIALGLVIGAIPGLSGIVGLAMLIPTLAFGVPGSTSMAILLAAFYMVGIPPGPKLLTEHVDLVYLIFWTLAVSNIIAACLCFWMTDYFAKVTKMNIHILAPLVIMLIYAGAYTTTLEIGDIIALL